MTSKILLAFDFDHTLINENSDLYIQRLGSKSGIPQEIKDHYSSTGWTEYMGKIFQFLYSHGVCETDYKSVLREIELTLGIKELFNFIKSAKDKFEIIIISDSNSIFIDVVLERYSLKDMVSHVYTNPASFDANGCLQIEYYHTQDWCKLSTVNLCKGHILKDYIKQRESAGVHFTSVFYVGDGSNDFCPGLTLSSNDYLCPRVGFSLWKKVNKLMKDEDTFPIKAQIYPWESGTDLVDLIKSVYPKF